MNIPLDELNAQRAYMAATICAALQRTDSNGTEASPVDLAVRAIRQADTIIRQIKLTELGDYS